MFLTSLHIKKVWFIMIKSVARILVIVAFPLGQRIIYIYIYIYIFILTYTPNSLKQINESRDDRVVGSTEEDRHKKDPRASFAAASKNRSPQTRPTKRLNSQLAAQSAIAVDEQKRIGAIAEGTATTGSPFERSSSTKKTKRGSNARSSSQSSQLIYQQTNAPDPPPRPSRPSQKRPSQHNPMEQYEPAEYEAPFPGRFRRSVTPKALRVSE